MRFCANGSAYSASPTPYMMTARTCHIWSVRSARIRAAEVETLARAIDGPLGPGSHFPASHSVPRQGSACGHVNGWHHAVQRRG